MQFTKAFLFIYWSDIWVFILVSHIKNFYRINVQSTNNLIRIKDVLLKNRLTKSYEL